MVATSQGVGRYYSNEGDLVMTPHLWRSDGTVPGVLYLHGATQTQDQMIDTSSYNGIRLILTAIAEAGFPVVGIYAGGDSWGNDVAMARISDGITYLQQTIGAKPGPVVLIGGSMGGCNVQVYTGTYPNNVLCTVGVVPVTDLNDLCVNRGFGASINAAYSGSYTDATYGAAHNPIIMAANGLLDQVPYRAWYGASDTTCLPGFTQTCVADMALGSAVQVAGDHNGALSNIPAADVLAFVREHAG